MPRLLLVLALLGCKVCKMTYFGRFLNTHSLNCTRTSWNSQWSLKRNCPACVNSKILIQRCASCAFRRLLVHTLHDYRVQHYRNYRCLAQFTNLVADILRYTYCMSLTYNWNCKSLLFRSLWLAGPRPMEHLSGPAFNPCQFWPFQEFYCSLILVHPVIWRNHIQPSGARVRCFYWLV